MKHLHQWILVAAVMAQAGTIEAQTVNWVEMGSPSARSSMGMAYDWATKSTVLFGGGGTGVIYGDTWIWRGGWSHLSPATSPSARAGAGMAYDGAAGNIVLFGGDDSTGTDLNDTWTWDGTTWTQQFPPLSPPARPNGFRIRSGDREGCPIWRRQQQRHGFSRRHVDVGRDRENLDRAKPRRQPLRAQGSHGV